MNGIRLIQDKPVVYVNGVMKSNEPADTSQGQDKQQFLCYSLRKNRKSKLSIIKYLEAWRLM